MRIKKPTVALLFSGLLALACCPTPTHAQGSNAPSPVVVSRVVEDNVRLQQMFVGSVEPSRESEIGSAVDGRVVEFPVREGDYVEKGQKLAQLLTGLLEIEKRHAEAERDLRKQELLELKNGSRPEEIEQARAQLANRKALADYARMKLERLDRLARNGTVTADELDDAISRAEAADQFFQEATAAYNLLLKGPRAEQIAQAEARLAMAEESINQIEDQIVKHEIKSPFNGYVVAEHTQVGSWVARAGLVAKVIELDEVDVECEVLESYIPYIREGMTATIEIAALPDQLFEGTVYRVVPQADLRSRTFPVKVRLKNQIDENKVPLIQAGMFARVRLPVGKEGKSLLVPKDAIVLGGSPKVFVVDAKPGETQGMSRPVPVSVGASWKSLVQVSGDLKVGDRVITRGNERMFGPTPVSIQSEIAAPKEVTAP